MHHWCTCTGTCKIKQDTDSTETRCREAGGTVITHICSSTRAQGQCDQHASMPFSWQIPVVCIGALKSPHHVQVTNKQVNQSVKAVSLPQATRLSWASLLSQCAGPPMTRVRHLDPSCRMLTLRKGSFNTTQSATKPHLQAKGRPIPQQRRGQQSSLICKPSSSSKLGMPLN